MYFIAKPWFTINRDGKSFITDKNGIIDCPEQYWKAYHLIKIEKEVEVPEEVIEEKTEIKEVKKTKRKTK